MRIVRFIDKGKEQESGDSRDIGTNYYKGIVKLYIHEAY